MYLLAMIFVHGKDDFDIWYPDVPLDEPLLNEFFMKYDDRGYSLRGTKDDILDDLEEGM